MVPRPFRTSSAVKLDPVEVGTYFQIRVIATALWSGHQLGPVLRALAPPDPLEDQSAGLRLDVAELEVVRGKIDRAIQALRRLRGFRGLGRQTLVAVLERRLGRLYTLAERLDRRRRRNLLLAAWRAAGALDPLTNQ